MRSIWILVAGFAVFTACGAPPPQADGGTAGGAAMAGGAVMAGGTAGGAVMAGGAAGGAVMAGGTALGGGAATGLPRIDSIQPQVVMAGDQIAVLGAGLVGVQSIRVDGMGLSGATLPSTAIKPGSSAALMLINAPGLIGLPPAGAQVTLTVTTGAGTAQGTFTLLPGVASFLTTNTLLTPRGIVPGGAIQPGTNYTLTVDVKIASSRDQLFDVSAAVEGAGFALVDVLPGTLTLPASSATTPVVTPVTVTVRAGSSGTGLVGLKVRPRGVAQDGSILVPRVALEVGATPVVDDGVLFGNTQVDGPHGLDPSTFVPVVRAFSGFASTHPLVQLEFDVGVPEDAGVLAINGVTAPPGWNPMASGQVRLNSAGALATMSITFNPTVADGGFAVPNGEFSFAVENATTGKSRPFRGQLQVVR